RDLRRATPFSGSPKPCRESPTGLPGSQCLPTVCPHCAAGRPRLPCRSRASRCMRSGGNSSTRRPSPRRCGAPSATRAAGRQGASPSTCWGKVRVPPRTPIAVRLVKGAYWDAEVKRAQELGLARYPVFTDKRLTDLSYLACARRLSVGPDGVRPQFATHNPVTLACVLALADRPGGASASPLRFEWQRLHGMGGALYRALAATHPH